MTRINEVHRDTLSCEPILRRMANGELLCVSQCGDVAEPAPMNRVYFFHSKDNGETWSPPVNIYPETGEAVYLTEVMVLGDIISVFLTIHNGSFLNWHHTIMESNDSGYTWKNAGPPPLTDGFIFFRGMLKLSDGNILLPYQRYAVSDEQNRLLVSEKSGIWMSGVPEVENGVMISNDNGKNYTRCTVPCCIDIQERWSWTEPTLAELSNGKVVMVLRDDGTGQLWQSESENGGMIWSQAERMNIPNPGNKPKLICIGDGRIALIHTPSTKNRFPLEIWISDDDMKTWSYRKKITDFPGTYNYADGFYEDGHILFTIEHNRHDILMIDHKIER